MFIDDLKTLNISWEHAEVPKIENTGDPLLHDMGESNVNFT